MSLRENLTGVISVHRRELLDLEERLIAVLDSKHRDSDVDTVTTASTEVSVLVDVDVLQASHT